MNVGGRGGKWNSARRPVTGQRDIHHLVKRQTINRTLVYQFPVTYKVIASFPALIIITRSGSAVYSSRGEGQVLFYVGEGVSPRVLQGLPGAGGARVALLAFHMSPCDISIVPGENAPAARRRRLGEVYGF